MAHQWKSVLVAKEFSLLGTQASRSSWQFNLTLIVSAALFAALIDYIFVSLRQKAGSHYRQNIFASFIDTLCYFNCFSWINSQ